MQDDKAQSSQTRVISVTPSDGDSEVKLSTPIRIVFSGPLNIDVFNPDHFLVYGKGHKLTKTFLVSKDNCTVTLQVELPPSVTITLTLRDNIVDAKGQPIANWRSGFDTTNQVEKGDVTEKYRALTVSDWQKWFAKDSSRVREALIHLNDEECILTLIGLLSLRASNSVISVDARHRLVGLGDSVLEPIAAKLRDADNSTQEMMASVFKGIGPSAIPVLMNLLNDTDYRQRRGAVLGLQAFGDKAVIAKPLLINILEEPGLPPDLRTIIIETIWEIGPEEDEGDRLFAMMRDEIDVPNLSAQLSGPSRL